MSSGGVGFVGLGIMGQGMASRLLSEGIAGSADKPLVVWNRTPSKCESLIASHPDKVIEIKGSAKEVVECCDVTYCMLSTPEASRMVFEAEDGVLAGVADGKSVVDCATLAVEDMVRMHNAVADKGGRFLEAPVSGSKVPAAMGQLIFLCGGSKDVFDEVEGGALKAMGKASHFLGEVGYGTRAKLVVNSLMGTMVAAFSESLSLSESVGLDPVKMIEVIGQGAIQSPVYALKGPKMVKGDHAPNFPLKHAHKDMKLACDMAREAGAEFAVTEKAEEVFLAAMEDGELNVADEDFSAVFERVKKESKTE
eukprot:CAMPEP_0183307518 /NCGR_PEP_ID=MMETSP0160_2-20130417/17791_1 /TAXON_ID=2839 ORGANISM="Odontella Sinensis, Strain Grunow 1884" /NCGR_SAMPLE_ID=MMETSP0160_2 /ASSEMBLY_ACC=CAM_ASM_000250 /LENGTH=308 /DNA_ID=CAMNT_0025471123 /DNA_START=138 /DNA_END=1064 /DNA_ORIENTATION=+